MKNFWKEYCALIRTQSIFVKKHWVTYVIYTIVCLILCFAPAIAEYIQMKRYEKKIKESIQNSGRYPGVE